MNNQLILQTRARWLLPGLEVLWGICTFAQSRVTNVNQIYALRFLVGMLEAPVFAGTHFILGKYSISYEKKKNYTNQQKHRLLVLRSRTLQACWHMVHLQCTWYHG